MSKMMEIRTHEVIFHKTNRYLSLFLNYEKTFEFPKDMTNFFENCFKPEDSRPYSYDLIHHAFFNRSHLWGKLDWRQMKTWWPRQSDISGKDLHHLANQLKRRNSKGSLNKN